jgi:4-carboxymuconolactone decarboxylase
MSGAGSQLHYQHEQHGAKSMTTFASSLLSTTAMMLAGALSTPVHAQGAPAAPPAPVTVAAPGAQPTRAQTLMGDFAPKLAELTDNILYNDIWERPGLSKRDRSLATMAALITMHRPDQFRSHIALARTNGVTEQEISELITDLAFYAG